MTKPDSTFLFDLIIEPLANGMVIVLVKTDAGLDELVASLSPFHENGFADGMLWRLCQGTSGRDHQEAGAGFVCRTRHNRQHPRAGHVRRTQRAPQHARQPYPLSAMSTCRTCGVDPCVNRSFCSASRRADVELAAQRKAGCQRESMEVLRARRLLADSISLERAWHELNDHHNHPTPQVTIEALMHCVRQRGLAALKEPANVERLARCDAAAKAQIDGRIKKLIERKEP
jgi:hypothetical protein